MSATPTPTPRDFVSGVGVALVLIPQAMAYAELAGLPSQVGLFAAAVAPIAATFFASSPYLQTGPSALTALLTLGALVPLAALGSTEYVRLAALLAVVVGIARVLIGVLKTGWISYMMSRPMMDGFTSGAAILIIGSQLPGLVGVQAPDGGVLGRAAWTLANPGSWETAALLMGLVTVGVIIGSRRIHPLVPGVLIATIMGWTFSVLTDYSGSTVGEVRAALPVLDFRLPLSQLSLLILPGFVIALVGFAEAASISRFYAARERMLWSPDREFISQGVANLASGLFGGLPVGASFSRSSLNYLSGARTRWSGAATGVTVLIFLPFAQVLSPLPRAILSAIVISAVIPLIRLSLLISLWRMSRAQASVGWLTFGCTLWLSPHVEQAVVIGVFAAVAIHMWRELRPGIESWTDTRGVHIRPAGVLWFGSAAILEEMAAERLAREPDAERLVIHLEGLGRIDLTGALALGEFIAGAKEGGFEVELEGVPAHAERILHGVLDWQPPQETER